MQQESKKYIADDERLMREWDWEANAGLNPNTLTYGSNKKVWWKCSKCCGKWQATVSDRTRGHTGCPECANRALVHGFNDLATKFPNIAPVA